MRYFYTFLKRLFFLIIIYFSSRLFFYFFNSNYFSKNILLSLFEGIRFDISALLYINIPLIILLLLPINLRVKKYYKKLTNFIFKIINIPFIIINNIDIEYFKFSQKRSTYDFFEYLSLGNGSDALNLIPQYFLDYWHISLITIIQIYLLLKIKYIPSERIKNYFSSSILFVIMIGVFILGARGGFQLKPIKPIDAGIWSNTENSVLVLNTPFCILHTYNIKDLEILNYFGKEEILHYCNNKNTNHNEIFTHKNVVIIILESFSKEFVGYYNNGKGYTPFLDSLINYSLVMERGYANGIKSIEALPSIVSSIPTLMNNPFITSTYATNKYYSLPLLLHREGYSTSFFHGGNRGTMGFLQFSQKSGFEKYFGREDYNNDKDYDGSWGIYDGAFFKYFSEYLNNENEPFLSSIFSLSSHHPYNIPKEYKNSFNKGDLIIHESISYTDSVLGDFFRSIKGKDWFENTLFVITSDHTSPERIEQEYKNKVGRYSIPIIYFMGDSSLVSSNKTVTQQIDIMPTILDLLKYNKDFFSFGKSIFSKKNWAISYLNNEYLFITDSSFIFNKKENYNSFSDANKKEKIKIKKEELNLFKAIKQNYNNRMINNKMTNEN